MTQEQAVELVKLISSVTYGEIRIIKQGGKIVNVEKRESIKLSK